MIRAVLLLVAGATGCGRVGFADLGDAVTGDGQRDDSAAGLCDPVRVSATPYTAESSVTITATPTDIVVFSAVRGIGQVSAQRFTPSWDAIDPTPFNLTYTTRRLSATYTDRVILARQDDGSLSTTFGIVTFPTSGPNFLGTGGIASAPGEPAWIRQPPGAEMVSPDLGGWILQDVDATGAWTVTRGSAGTGDPSLDCVAASADGYAAAVCSKATTQETCVGLGKQVGASPYSMVVLTQSCQHPAMAQSQGRAIAVYDDPAGGLRMASFSNGSAGTGSITYSPVTATGDHAVMAVDSRGLAVGYRAGGSVMTLGLDAATDTVVRAPTTVIGVPAAVGMAAIGDGDRTMLFIATASGLYRACV